MYIPFYYSFLNQLKTQWLTLRFEARGKITKGLLKELKFDDDFMLNLDSDCLTDGGTHILKLHGQISESVR